MDDTKQISGEEIEQLNVRYVIDALNFFKTEATEDELVECFSTSHEIKNDIQEEIKRILDHGVTNGMIVRNGNKYTLPSRQSEYQIDGDDDDSDVEYIDPNISHYQINSSPSALREGAAYTRLNRSRTTERSPTPPPRPKRKYSKRQPEPTDRRTRSQSRAAAARGSPMAAPRSQSVADKRSRRRSLSRVAGSSQSSAARRPRSPARKRTKKERARSRS